MEIDFSTSFVAIMESPIPTSGATKGWLKMRTTAEAIKKAMPSRGVSLSDSVNFSLLNERNWVQVSRIEWNRVEFEGAVVFIVQMIMSKSNKKIKN